MRNFYGITIQPLTGQGDGAINIEAPSNNSIDIEFTIRIVGSKGERGIINISQSGLYNPIMGSEGKYLYGSDGKLFTGLK